MSRSLLDLAIARLPLKAGQQTALCRALKTEDELRRITEEDFCRFVCGAGGLDGFDNENRLFGADEGIACAPRKLRHAWAAIGGALAAAEEDAAFMEKRGTGSVSVTDERYPALLKTVYDPPPVLFFRGNAAVLDDFASAQSAPVRLALVGTRKPSARAMAWAYKTARELAAAGFCIVSGLALGIDAQSHRAALDAYGKTYAVLGSSVDEVFPATNRALARRIIEKGGALLSEYPPRTAPRKWHYPARNRIISGLCPALIVVEAGEKSGALITADFALEQNRDLYVAADRPADGGADDAPAVFGEGCRRLAFDGAKPVYGAADIFEEFGLVQEAPSAPSAPQSLAGSLARELGI